MLGEIVAPQLRDLDDENSAIFAYLSPVYTVVYNLFEGIRDEGVIESFERLGDALEQSFGEYFSNYARCRQLLKHALENEAVRQVQERLLKSDEGKGLRGMGILDLLAVPLSDLHVWYNLLSKLKPLVGDGGAGGKLNGVMFKIESLMVCLCCFTIEPLSRAQQDQELTKLEKDLVKEKRSFFVDLLRREKRMAVMKPGRVFYGHIDVKAATLQEPQNVRGDLRLYLFDDYIVLCTKTNGVIAEMDTRAIVVSERTESKVCGNDGDKSFSLFWNRGRGRSVHRVFFVETPEQAQRAMIKINTIVRARLNGSSTKNYFLVRERKYFHGRSNEFGTEFHYVIWGFGWHKVYRYDCDSGRILSFHRSRELVSYVKRVTSEGESRLIVRFDHDVEVFELSSFDVASAMPYLDVLLQHKRLMNSLHKYDNGKRRQRLPWDDMDGKLLMTEEQMKARNEFEQKIRNEVTQEMQQRIAQRLHVIQQEYNELSYLLYEKETDVRELEVKLAASNAMDPAEVYNNMTMLERKQREAIFNNMERDKPPKANRKYDGDLEILQSESVRWEDVPPTALSTDESYELRRQEREHDRLEMEKRERELERARAKIAEEKQKIINRTNPPEKPPKGSAGHSYTSSGEYEEEYEEEDELEDLDEDEFETESDSK